MRTYQNPVGWRGYWGSPAEASAALGKDLIDEFIDRGTRLAEKVLAREDLSNLPVFPNTFTASPEAAAEAEAVVKTVLDAYAARTADIEAWLKAREAGGTQR